MECPQKKKYGVCAIKGCGSCSPFKPNTTPSPEGREKKEWIKASPKIALIVLLFSFQIFLEALAEVGEMLGSGADKIENLIDKI